MSSSTLYAQKVYDFQKEIFKVMLEKFDGAVVGSEEFNMDKLVVTFFDDYVPGKKMVQKGEKKPKKPRALSGYTFFGKENKDDFNSEMEKLDEKPKYVTFVGKKWKALTDEEKEEWNKKALTAFAATEAKGTQES